MVEICCYFLWQVICFAVPATLHCSVFLAYIRSEKLLQYQIQDTAPVSSVSRNGLKYSDWLGRTENQCKVLCLSNESFSAHICMHTTVKCHNSSGNYGNMCKLGDSACSWPVVHAQLPKLQMQSQIKPINAPQQCKNCLFSITRWFLDKAVINLELWIFLSWSGSYLVVRVSFKIVNYSFLVCFCT